MRIFRDTRTPIAALIVLTLITQSVFAGPTLCRCAVSKSEVDAKACCHTETKTPSCCDHERHACCAKDSKGPCRKCGQTGLCNCGCDQHRRDPPAAPSSPSESTDVKQKLAADVAPKFVDAVALSLGDRLATTGASALDRASPSVQVFFCIWQT